jgi:hypothetical protein
MSAPLSGPDARSHSMAGRRAGRCPARVRARLRGWDGRRRAWPRAAVIRATRQRVGGLDPTPVGHDPGKTSARYRPWAAPFGRSPDGLVTSARRRTGRRSDDGSADRTTRAVSTSDSDLQPVEVRKSRERGLASICSLSTGWRRACRGGGSRRWTRRPTRRHRPWAASCVSESSSCGSLVSPGQGDHDGQPTARLAAAVALGGSDGLRQVTRRGRGGSRSRAPGPGAAHRRSASRASDGDPLHPQGRVDHRVGPALGHPVVAEVDDEMAGGTVIGAREEQVLVVRRCWSGSSAQHGTAAMSMASSASVPPQNSPRSEPPSRQLVPGRASRRRPGRPPRYGRGRPQEAPSRCSW